MRKAGRQAALTLALGFGLIGSASAATQTISGLHTSFSFDDALLSLFGAPSVSGDTIYFNPTTFVAQSKDGGATGFTNAPLNITVTANAGYVLNGIDLSEKGDYLLLRPVGTGALGVGVTGQIRVLDKASLNDVTSGITAAGPLTVIDGSSHNWIANADTSFAAWQSKAVNLTIENLLYAYTTSIPAVAFIEKTFVGASVLVTAVPEPETYAMFLAGLGMLGAVVRRRMAA